MEQAGTGRTTRQIDIGALKVGGDAPVVVQSMCATRTIDIDADRRADASARARRRGNRADRARQ